MIKTPYLLFLGDAPDQLAAKVAQGIKDWRPDNAVAQFRMDGCGADVGLSDMTLAEAQAAGAKTLVIGGDPVRIDVHPSTVKLMKLRVDFFILIFYI